MALQNLRSSTANKRPVATSLSDGQIALNINAASPGIFFKNSSNVLTKVGPIHIGTSAPNSSPAGSAGNAVGEQWMDTSGSAVVMKVWDGSAWQEQNKFGAVAGTAAAPSIYFAGDTDTGIYSPGANQVAISTGGSGRLFVDSSGRVGIGNTNPGDYSSVADDLVVGNLSGAHGITIAAENNNTGYLRFADGTANSGQQANGFVQYSHADLSLRFGVDAQERARIDSSGRLLVGTSTSFSAPVYPGSWTTQYALPLQVAGTSVVSTGALLASFSNNNLVGAHLGFCKSSSGTVGSLGTAVADDATLGTLSFSGDDGSKLVSAAAISAEVDGTPGANDMPGRLVFSTTADGAASPTERMRIESGGKTKFSGGAYGIERTATASAFDLNEGNFWTCGAIAIPNPTNQVAGMMGSLRVTAAPTSFAANWNHPGGTYTAPTSFPAVAPFYVQASGTILLGSWTEGIA